MGYLKGICFKNKLAAFYEAMVAGDIQPSFYEKYLIYQLTMKIENKLEKIERHDGFSIEIDNLINFQQAFAKMQEDMKIVLDYFIGFWKELREKSPNFHHIQNLAYDISVTNINIRHHYKNLIILNPSNLYCCMLYAL